MSGDVLPWAGGRVAIVHDWFQGYHGAERVVEVLVRDVFADAARVDVLTFHAARELLPPRLASRIVRESRVAGLPGIRQQGHHPGRWRWLLPYMSRYFRSLDLSGYDFVLASSHAAAAHVNPPLGVPYACYCHSPMRYVWLPDAERGRVSGAASLGLRLMAPGLRRRDRRAASRPDCYLANSRAVRNRIRTFYGRSARVIHPPVDLAGLAPAARKASGKFLWVNRLVAYKRPRLVLDAFRGSPYQLTMVGVGPLESQIRAQLPPNVELRGWVSRDELAELYATAGGFVHVGEEDFGISMVEALAAGSPVVALDRGGAKDIVEHGKHGVLISNASVETLRAGLRQVAEGDWDVSTLRSRAELFARQRFVAEMRSTLASAVDASH